MGEEKQRAERLERREDRKRQSEHHVLCDLVEAVEKLSENLGKYGSQIATALAIIASGPDTDPALLQKLTERLKASHDKLEAAVEANQPAVDPATAPQPE